MSHLELLFIMEISCEAQFHPRISGGEGSKYLFQSIIEAVRWILIQALNA